MTFYNSIVDKYDLIFPLQDAQVSFINKRIPAGGKLLDVGCGTGSLIIKLARMGVNCTGADPDAEMLNAAMKKADSRGVKIAFFPVGMLETAGSVPSTFDGVTCLGNTLVHLGSLDEVRDFFLQCRKKIVPRGRFIIQIVNYDRILDQQINHLPTIENEFVKFERNYALRDGKISFFTRLTDNSTGRTNDNVISLIPIRKVQISRLLSETGFMDFLFYGDFSEAPFSSESFPLIVVAT